MDEDCSVIQDPDQIMQHIVHYMANFNGVVKHIDDELFDVHQGRIRETESLAMNVIPAEEEIKAAVFDLGAESAPRPDGYSGIFYKQCSEVLDSDLILSITHCWQRKFIPNGVNSSMIILLPKEKGGNTLKNYLPIGLSNFIFKKFTKILASRLGGVFENLISEEQVAILKGRNIHGNFSVASDW